MISKTKAIRSIEALEASYRALIQKIAADFNTEDISVSLEILETLAYARRVIRECVKDDGQEEDDGNKAAGTAIKEVTE